MPNKREAVIAATKQHHARVATHLATCEKNQEGYQKHGKFLMEMQDYEVALRNLCVSEELNFDDFRYEQEESESV